MAYLVAPAAAVGVYIIVAYPSDMATLVRRPDVLLVGALAFLTYALDPAVLRRWIRRADVDRAHEGR